MRESNRTFRGALIGCGYFGRIQLEAWRRMPDVEIVAACDVDLSKARVSAPKGYASVEELLQAETLDFIDIATRPDTHLSLVRAAVERGIPAICQKPVAPTLDDAVAMAKLVQANAARVMIHENWRWQPWYREAKSRIDRGEIGQPITYNFRHRQRDGLGPEPYKNQPYFRVMPRLLIYETLVHYIDTARFLFGDIEGLSARTRQQNRTIQAEDGAVILLDHESGVTGVVNGNRYLNPEYPGPAMGEAWLEGDESWIRIAANGDLHLGTELVWQSPTTEGYKGDSVRATQRHFLDCLSSGRPFETGVMEYLPTFAAVEAAYRSAVSKKQVRIAEVLG
jgi:predicted dehydrogenase